MVSFTDELETWRQAVEAELTRKRTSYYPEATRLHEACRYALEGPGKRIRPLLALGAAEALGGSWRNALPAAIAIEWIHTYSLVHDDLPTMDDDDLRRGRATTHKVFDEATALLVGDALLTDAFAIILGTPASDAQKIGMLSALASSAGGRGMVLGQALDMHWTGRPGYGQNDLDRIHELKTGCLIRAACAIGAWSAGATAAERLQLEEFGARIGLAFQIVDDLLDERSAIGKTSGKDRASGKLTYLTLMSAEEAGARAEALTFAARASLEVFGAKARPLLDLAGLLLQRQL
jgi:farnesyl diphosphate synthase